jgi:hypothetical protein
MYIVQRNFFRLIRCGAFSQQEQVEPMSVFKWGQLFQLAIIHDVASDVYLGLLQCKDQFFLHMTDAQWNLWEKTVNDIRRTSMREDTEDNDFLRADHLTNPLLNRKLQDILDDENSDTRTRQLLLTIIRTSRHILNEGVPIKELVRLGKELRQTGNRTDFTMLENWIKSLKFQQAAHLEGALLVELFGFEKEEIPFIRTKDDPHVKQVALELIEFTHSKPRKYYFSQGDDNIFIHTNNGSAILGQVRRSARYFRYFPSETLTNFLASFAHSLSHIEE